MKFQHLIACIAVGVGMLVGCATPPDKAETTLTAEPEAAASTPAQPGMSVPQYASMVAESEGKWRELVDQTDEYCLDPDRIPACSATYASADLTAKLLHLVISCTQDPSCKTYAGEPPSEIAALVVDTESAAEAFSQAYAAWNDAGCVDPLDSKCGRESIEMRGAMEKLTAKFDAWRPYMSG